MTFSATGIGSRVLGASLTLAILANTWMHMGILSMIQIILTIMVALQPSAPWRDSYEKTAIGIYEGAQAEPIFSGEYGIQRTIALDIAIAWFESRFNPQAVGDKGKSWGLYQVQGHGQSDDVKTQTIIANKMVLQSFRVCKSKPLDERLGWYAAGGNDCERGLRESRHRMGKAQWIFRKWFGLSS